MSNTLFAFWIGLSAALLLLFVYAAFVNLRNRQARPVTLDELIPSFLPVDVETFAELVNTSAGSAFSRAHGERTDQTIECLRRMSQNAALLQRLGYAQSLSGNPLINDLAQQMIDAGVHVRFYTFVGLTVLRLGSLLRFASIQIVPAHRIIELQQMMSGSLIPAYEQLREKAGNLTCLKFSALHEALSQSL